MVQDACHHGTKTTSALYWRVSAVSEPKPSPIVITLGPSG
jgi:hypothetical protein